jgi:hypoxanthine phosphoribosyltransferase
MPLQGASEFATDLTRALRRRHAYSSSSHLPFTVDYVRVKSYEGTESSGTGEHCTEARLVARSAVKTLSVFAVKISGIDLKTLAGRDLILVEDIVDTGMLHRCRLAVAHMKRPAHTSALAGHTMAKLIPHLMELGLPRSVKVASLLEKRTARSCGFRAHYVGFSIPDAFVIGYNMDYNEAFRELPHLCVINAAGIDFFRKHSVLASLL